MKKSIWLEFCAGLKCTTEMANRTNSSEYFWSYEYYWDYIDPIPVDGSKLKVNKCKYCRVVVLIQYRKNVA